MRLDDITIVLARPSEPGNTGAVCRAVKNMGLRRLRIAAPEFPRSDGSGSGSVNGCAEPDLKKLLARAVHAEDIWEGTEWFGTLQEALADCSLSVGTSRRRGKHRKSATLTPRELAAFLKEKNGRAAVVFGNERTGLDGAELELCSLASHIPASPAFPSLNLSHAVQIYAYELYQALAEFPAAASGESTARSGPAPVPGQWIPMNSDEINGLVRDISDSLSALGFYKHPGREEQERFLRDLAARAGLSTSEGRYLGAVIAKAGRLSPV